MTLRTEDTSIETLVRRAQEGDERAFTDLYERHFDRVYGYLRIALEDDREAEDASRQVFLKVVGLISGYESGEQPFNRWLFQLARNEALDRLRDRDGIDAEEAAEAARAHESVRTDRLRARLWNSDSELMALIEGLPVAERRSLMLRYVLDLEDGEIAEALGVSPRHVRRLQRGALDRLKRVHGPGSRARRARSRTRVMAARV